MELLGLFFIGVPVSVLVLWLLLKNIDNPRTDEKLDDTNSNYPF